MGAEKAAPEKYRSIAVRLALPWCPFRKFHPAQVRIVRQNHRIIESDVCNPARARNVRRRIVVDQRLANDTPQPNKNKRPQT